jgi:hypothetical protein
MRIPLLLTVLFASSSAIVAGGPQSRTERGEAAATLSADGQSFGDGARLAGVPRTCVPLSEIRNSRVLSDRVIDFGNGNRWKYRVVLPQACPSLGFEQRFAYSTSLSQLCAQDIITVLQQTGGLSRGASCGLAPFQPIEPPPHR